MAKKYLTNFASRRRNSASRPRYFLHAAGVGRYKRVLRRNHLVNPFPSSIPLLRSFPFSVFIAENCNFPRREGMRLSVDGFLNANNSGNRNHRRQSLPSSSFSLFRSPVPPSSRDTAGALFYKPGVEIERVGVSISQRLLIHDYRPPWYSLPECKMAVSPDRRLVALGVYFFFIPPPFSPSSF